jgi:hypothetical protein
VVPTEWNARARRGKFTDESGDPREKEKDARPPPSQQAAGGKEERGKKHEDIGPKEDRLEEESEDIHDKLSAFSDQLSAMKAFKNEFFLTAVHCSLLKAES